ncbi:2-oxoacid dehydrogenase/acyltransferase catalytic subunit [Nonomuraea polychroma]|uniref:2-oxoacid dehydrogenase/acyltransferase catalytic subunit n=1 Tax=Nonomuraea polychroma TaxID=46176 RepID=A0A438LZ08_9ACTN|nr:2-oxo acid dehydrogenase subunit E2 [Nonomuraea polychroma]RVX38776.1 2-oxoacid dehydrogenase/acyltransferase catalytic subunit [Nonomuraea polychroma]
MTERAFRQAPIPRERRHTLIFLDETRAIQPVFLGTGVDVTEVRAHQAAARAHGRRYSMVSYVLHTAARVLALHPEANAAVRGRRRPRVAWYQSVNGKLTLDKSVNGQRVVVSTVLRDLHKADLDEIQRQVDHFRDGDPATMPEFAPMRLLQRLPWSLARLAYRLGVRPLARRSETMGTFAVTSLGHRPVEDFYSVGGATVTLGLGAAQDSAVVRDGEVAVAPIMRLSLTFDHRVIDGAEAADVLAEIKEGLETCRALESPVPAGHPAGRDADRDQVEAEQ